MRLLVLLALVMIATTVHAVPRQTDAGVVEVSRVADGLKTPWGVAFLPGGGFLVTERGGKLWLFAQNGKRQAVRGTPKVKVKGQGGLLDVLVPRDFASTRQVYLSYAKPQRGGAGTAVGVGRLSEDGRALTGFQTILEMHSGGSGGRHFGSRLVESADGTLFVTVGERGDDATAQDLTRLNGSVVRIGRAGSIPSSNPFVRQTGARPEIWSLGHRNPQGMAFDGRGRLWAVEHGAKGGDEVNLIRKGANYGWPVIAYGRHYSGAKIGVGTARDGMEQPAHYWDPSIAPSGLAILSGRGLPGWKGDFLVGSLKFDMISRLEHRGGRLVEAERLSWPETDRVRDVREAPDGSVWFISEGRGAIYRIAPSND